MKLIDYRNYCNEVFLTEEKLKDVVERLKVAFPDEAEFTVYNSILDLFPSLAAKSIIVSVLVRTREERKAANVSPQQTKQVFDHLLELLRRNIKVDLADMLKKDRTQHPDNASSHLFTELTELIHFQQGRIQALQQKKLQKRAGVGDLAQEVDTKFPDPIYIDDEFEVYEAKSPAECQNYMGNSTICLKHPENFWGSYRIPHASAIYYIFPRTPNAAYVDQQGGRHRFLQIELRKNGSLVWTWEDNMMNNMPSLEALKQKFPELGNMISKGVFKIRPHAPGEVENFRKIQSRLDDEAFKHLGYEIRTMYIANGHQLTDGQWSMIDKNQKNAYVNFSMNRDVTPSQYEEIKQDQSLLKRYSTIKKRGLEAKIKSGEFIRDGASPHEAVVLPELLSSVNETTRQSIIKGLIESLLSVISGKIIPKNDLFGIYTMFKGQLLSSPAMKGDSMIQSVADILAGSKNNDWRTVQPNVKEGVIKIANDIYTANSTEMKPIIDAKIKSNPAILLQGLVSVPTPFQIQFFNEHEKELLSSKDFRQSFDTSILGHLVYGTQLPDWLKDFWNSHKKSYSSNKPFSEKIKYDLQHTIFGRPGEKFPPYGSLPVETKEVYDANINEIRNDPKTLDLVKTTMYDMVMNKKAEPSTIKDWSVSDDFKKYYTEHKNELESWLVFKLIDTPPEHVRPELVKLIDQHKNAVLTNPVYGKGIEEHLVKDVVTDEGVMFSWSGERIKYWLEHFWDIMAKHPGSEKALVGRIKKEFGTDRSANAFYTEYGIPHSFYTKHEQEILSDPEAYRGLKQKIIDTLVWRPNKEMNTQQAVDNDLSPIEKDFYLKHKAEFPETIVSVNNRGN